MGVRTGMGSVLIPVSSGALRSSVTAQALFLVQDACWRSVCSQQAVRAGDPAEPRLTPKAGERQKLGWSHPVPEPVLALWGPERVVCNHESSASVCLGAWCWSVVLSHGCHSPAPLWGCKQTPHGPALSGAA